MPVVTSIKPQKNQKRVNIYLDGKFGFGLDLENFVKFNLKVDQELDKKQINEIVGKDEFQKAANKLLNFATLRPRSEKEIKDWLKRKKVDEKHHKKLFTKLKRFDLIDDFKFTKWWVEQRLSFRKKSKKEIIFELRRKGIEKKVIDEVLSGFDIDEEKVARDLLKSKLYKWEKYDEKTKNQKQKEFLLRKGFSWNIVSKVVK